MLGIEGKIGALANPYNRWQSVLRSSSGKKILYIQTFKEYFM